MVIIPLYLDFQQIPRQFQQVTVLRSFPWPGLVSRVCGLSFCGCSFSISGVAQMFFSLQTNFGEADVFFSGNH